MKGLGIDMLAIAKFARVKKKDYKKWRHFFTLSEWSYAFQGNKAAEHLAAIFVLKEASMKALGRSGSGEFLSWQVLHLKSGQPVVKFSGSNKKKVKILASVSHENNFAIAVAAII